MTFKDWFTQEHDRDIGERVKDATSFNMPQEDRETVRARLLQYARINPVRTRLSRTQSNWFSFALHPMPVIATLLIVVVGTGSAGAASLAEKALPGDLLYSVKVNVNEEVRLALATTPQKKADVAIERAERRIEELNTLTERGEIEESIRLALDERIDAHVHDAEEISSQADEDDEGRLVAVLRAHENLIGAFETGGGVEPEVEFATFVAADATASIDASVPDGIVPEVALMASAPEDALAPKKDVRTRNTSTEDVAVEPSQRKSSVGEKVVLRQKKAAEQRVESLETLIQRAGEKADGETLVSVEADLNAAKEAIAEGIVLIEDEMWADASVRFNAAVRIAIDARETLTKSMNKRDRNNDSEDSNQGQEESGKGDDHQEDD